MIAKLVAFGPFPGEATLELLTIIALESPLCKHIKGDCEGIMRLNILVNEIGIVALGKKEKKLNRLHLSMHIRIKKNIDTK